MSNQLSNINSSTSKTIEQIFSNALSQLDEVKKILSQDGIPQKSVITTSPRTDLPTLPVPTSNLSLETLINAVGFEQRRTNCKVGLESIAAKGEQQKAANEKQLQEIAEQLDKMEQQKVANIFKKIFGIIGAIFGIIASVATIAAGAITGNPLLAVAGVVTAIMAIDSVLSTASDGKISLMAGFTELGKAMGMNEKDASYFALGMQLLMTAIATALSFGAGFANTASSTITNASTAANIMNKTQQVLNIGNGILSVGQGATTIANSVIQYQVEQSKVSQKELEAILERIRQAIEMEKDLIETEMERSNDLLNKVHEIVQDSNATQKAILTGTPNFA